MSAHSPSVLRRKLAPSRAPGARGAGAIETMLRKTMPRDADQVLSLDVLVAGVTMAVCDKTALLARLAPGDLIYRLQGDGEARGLCTLSPGLLAALIEVQMSGRVSAAKPAERAPTRTDGIVAGDMVDRWMASAVAAAADEDLGEVLTFGGYSRANGLLDRRNADLALDPGTYRTMAVDLSLGAGGEKTGTLFFAVPEHAGRAKSSDAGMAARLRGHLAAVDVPMRVVLARLPQPIGRIRALKPGDVIAVPMSALFAVRVEGLDGRLVDRGRLGQLNGHKAVRLSGASGQPRGKGPRDAAATDALDAFREQGALPPPAAAAKLPKPAATGRASPAGGASLPGLPDLPGVPDLPDLPPLAGFPDFPAPPDLPDLEAS